MADKPQRPAWLRVKAVPAEAREAMGALLSGLHTVCQEANCPNIGECFARGTATFMILGGLCTRCCRFCAVKHGIPGPPDPAEPARVAEAAHTLKLKHVVVTSVTRDDLPDGGAAQFVECIKALHALKPAPTVEVLVPDFNGDIDSVNMVLAARPEIFNHNIETVPRLYADVRPQADYARSLGVLAHAHEHGGGKMLVKSGLMVGLSETFDEIIVALGDLRAAGVDIVTIGQYLRPTMSHRHVEMVRYVKPAEFEAYADAAREMGFRGIASSPLVRSSYHAEEQLS
jgi:lipoic acid synthetase